MSFLTESLLEALERIARLDRRVLEALFTTLRVSVASTCVASALALPAGFLLAYREFPGKRAILALLKTALALPTVVVALFVYSFLTRDAPLGRYGLLYTPAAIVMGQVLLVTPLVTALVHGVLHGETRNAYEEAVLLGASPFGAFRKTLVESRVGVTTALMTGFGRVISEIGVSLILGGNILGYTRTMTTAIALESSQGEFAEAMALGMLLLGLVLLLNLAIQATGGAREAV